MNNEQKIVLAIYREEIFSNRAIDADRAIIDAAISQFVKMNPHYKMQTIKAEDFEAGLFVIRPNLIFCMAESDRVLKQINRWQKKGTVILNSTSAINNCIRVNLLDKVSKKLKTFAKAKIENVEELLKFKQINIPAIGGLWLKRGDFHALDDQDVVHISNQKELKEALHNFSSKGIKQILTQKNIEGQIYKFYSVAGEFVSYRYMGQTGHDRYHLNKIKKITSFDQTSIEDSIRQIPKLIGIDFFGGDFIVDKNGACWIIDINDWPSFRTCKIKASYAMAIHATILLEQLEQFEREEKNIFETLQEGFYDAQTIYN